IVDQYYQIYHTQFLEKVLIHFGLEEPNNITDHNYNSANDYYLSQNYPNPFNPSTIIKFSLPVILSGVEGSFVTLKIYNALGEEVAVLLDKELTTGTYEFEWNANNIPSGVYFYQLKTNGFMETKKMLMIK
ncbi:MAG: T9SS type A sorting domain-containing protein, partial [Ignavibacteria bacterium]|nr:T9SS type A sorting domain-containing protein [Ignavibacteria bacterium]